MASLSPWPAMVAGEVGMEVSCWLSFGLTGRGGEGVEGVMQLGFSLVLTAQFLSSLPLSLACSSPHGDGWPAGVDDGGGDFVLELFSDAFGVRLNGSRAAAPPLLCSAHRSSPALHRQVVRPRR
jgi:hypothetical protein